MRHIVLCAVLLAGCGADADFSGAIKTETLQTEKYQDEIATIDKFVFRERPLGEDGVQALHNVLIILARRVAAAKSDSKFLKLESLELRLLAEHASSLPPNGTGKRLQNDWMRIRNNLFEDRAWFARSAADLDYAASVLSKPAQVEQPARAVQSVQIVSPVVEARATLTGRWKVVSTLANGQPRDDRELIGSIWSFDPPRLIVADGTGRETTYNCVVHAGDLMLTTPAGVDGWTRYELGSEGLRLAFYDGLKGKPQSFDPEPGRSDPMLVVIRLVRMP